MQMKNIIHTIFHFLIQFNTMANNLISTTFIVVLFSLDLAGKSQTFSTSLPRSTLQLGRQNLTRLHFFFHDVVGGPNATAIRVAAAPTTNTSSTGFGAVVMMDNLLTVGPEPNSTRVTTKNLAFSNKLFRYKCVAN
ncbi:putative dirigent protein [Helianthus anomalus]